MPMFGLPAASSAIYSWFSESSMRVFGNFDEVFGFLEEALRAAGFTPNLVPNPAAAGAAVAL